MKAADAVNVIKGMIAASNSQNYEKLASFFMDDFMYEDLPLGKTCHSKKELIAFFSSSHANAPDHKWELKSSFNDGQRIATEWVWSGTPKERPASGKHVSFRGVSITELHNGKISRNTDYYNIPSPQPGV
jgi:steroid delta-isomerase-like uncharacterized protein